MSYMGKKGRIFPENLLQNYHNGGIVATSCFFIGFYQVPVLIKVSEESFTNVTTRSARHRGATFFLCLK